MRTEVRFLLAIGLIYGAFLYLKKHPRGLMKLMQMTNGQTRLSSQQEALVVESSLPLEIRKNLYIIRAGQERFLVATSTEGTQFLARLENAEPATAGEPAADQAATSPPEPRAEQPHQMLLGTLSQYLPKTCFNPVAEPALKSAVSSLSPSLTKD